MRGETKSGHYKNLRDKIEDDVDKLLNPSKPLQGEGTKNTIPSNTFDFCIRLELLLRLNLSGDTYTLIEANKLIDELYKRDEIQNEQQYRNVLDQFYTN